MVLLRRKIKCPDTLWLIDTIIDGSNEQEPVMDYFPDDDLLTPLERRKGLPIGNLTSQFFANIYLNHFDHFVKEDLKVKKYLRYVDDFALGSISVLQVSAFALIPQPLLPSLGEGESKLQVPLPRLGEGFRVRAQR